MSEITIIGELVEGFSLYYSCEGEKFYKGYIESMRTSGVADRLPMVISEYVDELDQYQVGDIIKIAGQVRSRDRCGKVLVYVFVNNINVSDESDYNSVHAEGCICKSPVYRLTPMGREITDLCLAVNRRHSSDYLPIVVWGRQARRCKRLSVGDRVEVVGRLQSRDYGKGVAYEISVSEISDNRNNTGV